MSELSFINELIKDRENYNIEFFDEYSLESIIKSVCAFLNSDGGWIIIGYSNNSFQGITDDPDGKIDELKNNIWKNIFPQPLVDIRKESYENKVLLLINIVRGSRRPYSYNKKYYLKAKHDTKEAAPDEISVLLRTSSEHISTWEKLNVIDASINDLVEKEIQLTIDEARRIGRALNLPTDLHSFLSYFQLMDLSLIRNGAVVLFGKEPTKFIPQCRIRITEMPHGKTGGKFENTILIEKNLFESFNRIHEYFVHKTPIVSEFARNDWNRYDREKYPFDALDEAILNAIVHRDYADVSGEIIINIYPDKLEIINSGEIPADIVTKKNHIKERHSILRNPTIAHILFLRGKIEKVGRGLLLIKDRFQEYGLRSPEWLCKNGYTTLTLFTDTKKVLLNKRCIEYLHQLSVGDKFTRKEYQQYFPKEIPERTARNDIQKMLDEDFVNKFGEGILTVYSRTSKKLPDSAGLY